MAHSELIALAVTAVTISCLHTASGPDHYLPFVVLSRSRKWTKSKTFFLTVICGIGHILSSVLIGMVGVFLGWQLTKISWLQDVRGNLSGWALLIFGIVYLVYGLRQAYLNKPHKHFDVMGDDVYVYQHQHGQTIMAGSRVKVTPLVLFAIFVMGPSEPLVPLLFYSGTHRSMPEVVVLITVFTISTVITMLIMVFIGIYGYSFFKAEKLERYMHAVGGAVLTMCGVGMVFLGW